MEAKQHGENHQLLIRAGEGDKSAQDLLVEQNTGLVHSVVKRFLGRGQEMEDLFQVGCIGLIKAVQKFDLGFDVRFSTYAVPMIMGEIKRFLRDDGIIKVSRSLKETAVRAMALREEITNRTGREPTLNELAQRLGISGAELSSALDAGIHPESLYAVPDDGNREQQSLLERLESTDTPEE
ncbi:MAG: sigma-70 family RNA polymerase sigma factor, partial [Clostridia bacterium]|nr:sigma-70 family RNA polymerase sigma factor [Clostridia bacterium]